VSTELLARQTEYFADIPSGHQSTVSRNRAFAESTVEVLWLCTPELSDETKTKLTLFNSIWSRKADAMVAFDAAIASRTTIVPALKESGAKRFVARQTILDSSMVVHGYELLFRTGWENCFRGDTDAATRMMIADGALHGFRDLTRDAAAFINCTRESLVSGLVTLLPNTTVLEILETVVGDAEVLEACARYKALGYKLALDDFRVHEGMDGLIDLADYIKIDFRLSDAEERRELLSLLKSRDVTLIAEKIETEQEFQSALAEGFTLFQGYYFCHPTVFSKKRAPRNGRHYLYLLSAMAGGKFDITQLGLMLKAEVTLSDQLLRLVNCAAMNAEREVSSLQEALALVGETQFRRLTMNAIATETCRHSSSALLVHVLHRARFLELMAPLTGEDPTEQYLLGLLSVMHVMLDMPAADLIDALPLRKEIKDALSGEPNKISRALRLLDRYEDANWKYCMEQSSLLHVAEDELSDLYEQSLVWAEWSAVSGDGRDALAS
jgi:EAL and modified HD-GYP domain-containing signal transduction protein